jgi:hypothetical protein
MGSMVALLALLLALDAGPVAKAPAPTAARSPLRDGKAILADYGKAIGDEELWKEHKSVRVKREVTVKSMQFVGQEETWVAKGGKIYGETKMPGMGIFRRGCDGRVAWASDPIGGLRILKDPEAEDVHIAATWNSEWHLANLYAKVVAVPPPETMPAGQSWECVELHKKKGPPTKVCFDSTTHLKVWEKGVQASQGGQVPYQTKFSDWRPVDGVQVWYRETVTVGPVTMESRIVDIVFNEPVAAKRFALPRKK